MQCPCCGSDMEPSLLALKFAKVSTRQRQILDFALEHYPRAITTAALTWHMFQLDPTGGPDDPANLLGVHVNRLNKAIKPLGWALSRLGHGKPGRRLVQLAAHEDAGQVQNIVKNTLTDGPETNAMRFSARHQ